MKGWLPGLGLLAAGALALVVAWPSSAPESPELVPQAVQDAQPAPAYTNKPQAAAPMPEVIGERAVAAADYRGDEKGAAPVPPSAAVASLRESMRNGDPRTPPLVRSSNLREPPTAQELADPSLYQQYEQRQKQQVYASFVAAASGRITELEGLIEQGEQGGVTPEQLEEGRRKLEALRQQRDQLLAQQPGLAGEESAAQE